MLSYSTILAPSNAAQQDGAQMLNNNVLPAVALVAGSLGEGEGSLAEEGEFAGSMNAAQRQGMRDQDIPTSQQPSSQVDTPAGRQYTYEVPKPGGGTETKVVQRNNGTDSSHPGQPHV